MKIQPLMKPFSEQPKPGQKVKVFLKDGRIVIARCCQVCSEDFNGLQWFNKKTGSAIDVNQIKGWMPFVNKE